MAKLAAKAKKAPKVPAIAGSTGGGMKLPEKKTRPKPKVSDTGGGLRRPKKKRPIRSGGDGLTPVRRKRAMSRRRTAMARVRAGNRRRRGLRR